MTDLEDNLNHFHYIPVLSREKWSGKNGYVHDVYLPLIKERNEKPLFYLCGWSEMVKETRENLARLNYKMTKDIRVEIFG